MGRGYHHSGAGYLHWPYHAVFDNYGRVRNGCFSARFRTGANGADGGILSGYFPAIILADDHMHNAGMYGICASQPDHHRRRQSGYSQE